MVYFLPEFMIIMKREKEQLDKPIVLLDEVKYVLEFLFSKYKLVIVPKEIY